MPWVLHDPADISLVPTVHQDRRIEIIILEDVDVNIEWVSLLLCCDLGDRLSNVLLGKRGIGHASYLKDIPAWEMWSAATKGLRGGFLTKGASMTSIAALFERLTLNLGQLLWVVQDGKLIVRC